MTYIDRFKSTDDLISHLQTIVPTLTDEELKSKYAGFLAASAVTVYELAIRDIFISFAEKKNSVFGTFVEKHFSQINGRIKINDLIDHVKLFGEKYFNKFIKKLEEKNKALLLIYHNDIKAIYGNLIICRHRFIHANNTTMSFNEVASGYILGKEIINVLYETMKR